MGCAGHMNSGYFLAVDDSTLKLFKMTQSPTATTVVKLRNLSARTVVPAIVVKTAVYNLDRWSFNSFEVA